MQYFHKKNLFFRMDQETVLSQVLAGNQRQSKALDFERLSLVTLKIIFSLYTFTLMVYTRPVSSVAEAAMKLYKYMIGNQ